jgi:protein-S-isoprenylcysteine O-methyltransferase Ste14
MKIKGLDTLVKHFPEMASLKFALIVLGTFSLTTVYFLLSDRIPTWTIDSQIVVFALGFLIVRRAFTQRAALIEKYGKDAYQQAAMRFIFPGVSILFAAIAHTAYMGDVNKMIFTQGVFPKIAHILGWYWVVVGALLWIRSVLTFGIDNLALLYLYHPQEGRIVKTDIYRILRHPVYAGIIRLCIGLALLNTGIFALSFIPFLPLLFFGWVRLVEEKELLERLPDYAAYRDKTPAFWVKPRDIPAFFKFLIFGRVL